VLEVAVTPIAGYDVLHALIAAARAVARAVVLSGFWNVPADADVQPLVPDGAATVELAWLVPLSQIALTSVVVIAIELVVALTIETVAEVEVATTLVRLDVIALARLLASVLKVMLLVTQTLKLQNPLFVNWKTTPPIVT